MNALSIFTPHILYIIGAFLVYWFFRHIVYAIASIISLIVFTKLSKHLQAERLRVMGLYKNQLTAILWILGVIMLIAYTLVFLSFVDPLMQVKPTEGWEKEIQEADTAIILGFGFEKDKEGNMIPGKANEFLLNWTLKNTSAKTILVQEGVWVAACEASNTTCTIDGREIKRIHLHDETNYVNTLETAFCAMEEMKKLDEKKAILVAHDLQLQRVAWDFERVSQEMCPDCTFVIPNMLNTPYPTDSVHWHTRNEFIYKIVELIGSRTRDFLSLIPIDCKAPLNIECE